jgi:hypothetical protein
MRSGIAQQGDDIGDLAVLAGVRADPGDGIVLQMAGVVRV